MSAVEVVVFVLALVATWELGRRYGRTRQLERDYKLARETIECGDANKRLVQASRLMLDTLAEFPDYPETWGDDVERLERALDQVQAAQRAVDEAQAREVA